MPDYAKTAHQKVGIGKRHIGNGASENETSESEFFAHKEYLDTSRNAAVAGY